MTSQRGAPPITEYVGSHQQNIADGNWWIISGYFLANTHRLLSNSRFVGHTPCFWITEISTVVILPGTFPCNASRKSFHLV
uniref:Uncharacterized protein n=1 Tax=Anguilla anguilla TaxID=7936 RepID=A0A0E9WQX6_ANGAN